jgi:predicted nucleotidyltransferase component of viral defense system
MKQVIRAFIHRRNPTTVREYDRALREVIQQIALLGLWRAGFFEHAAFYGDTALRIIHGIPRFSEDIDFSLLERKTDFTLEPYLSGLKTELAGFGFQTELSYTNKKNKTVDSAFIKANTRLHLLNISADPLLAETVPSNQLVKVKLEVDPDPPEDFSTEAVPLIDPIPFYIRIFSLPDLFAGKMHCVLCRRWRDRVKGRDWYDMIWFLRRETPLHLSHLEQRMIQSDDWNVKRRLNKDDFIDLYRKRVETTDFKQVTSDVIPFIQEPRETEIWGKDFFLSLIDRFRFV